ncbi:MAG: pyridoxal-phosphate dependent enzyme [Candidatus Melainabacteria bacterium]|nr:pyridoxal-phosphate dependent enzyme [Candidatus Melainabacteria bacterium]
MRASSWLSELSGAGVYLKLENLQVTGSFKYRGALNCLAWAKENGLSRIFTASTGNHGLAVAEASKSVASEVTICLPKGICPAKVKQLGSYNVKLIEHGDECQITEAYAQRLANEKKGIYVSPYNNPEVMSGQGTIALEMFELLPELTTIIAAVGGGGLIGGLGLAAKAINPTVRVIGVVAANSPAMKECVQTGSIRPVFVRPTLADSLAGNVDPDSITYPIVREVVDEWVAVDEADIAQTLLEFLNEEGMIIEGAAAAAVAAVAKKLIDVTPAEKVGVIVCGGNISSTVWKELLLARA